MNGKAYKKLKAMRLEELQAIRTACSASFSKKEHRIMYALVSMLIDLHIDFDSCFSTDIKTVKSELGIK